MSKDVWPIPLEKLYAIAETLSISITDLLIEEDEIVENELPNLIEEYKKIESQELRNALIRSLFEGIRICEEKVKRAEKIKIAKDLVKKRNFYQYYFKNNRHLFRRNSTIKNHHILISSLFDKKISKKD